MNVSEGVEYPSVFRITEFNREQRVRWMSENWTISIYASVLYLICLYVGQKVMRTRKAFDLQKPLVLWNFVLATFSITASLTVASQSLRKLFQPDGWYHVVCTPWSDLEESFLFYGWLFTLSKLVELGDTFFIVLRKKPLIFLHWYHHVTVLLYCWVAYPTQSSTDSGFIASNYFVHSIMYSYYFVRALKIKLPRGIPMLVTSLQIIQMAVGISNNIFALKMKKDNVPCDAPVNNTLLSLGILISYAILFLNFFVRTYGSRNRKNLKTEKMK